ncbi:MAG: hypothetical protein GF398_12335 [Chitinivibrionales bacterium]|nr:hypothetical protein [Chitinivibrionales bacterium]
MPFAVNWPFTGLHVKGQLTANGTTQDYIIFTSVHDQQYNTSSTQMANPFDWNGILIAKDAGRCNVRYFSLRYSVFGIKAQADNIRIKSGMFMQNGQFHFTVNDDIKNVTDNIPFSYGLTESTESPDDKKIVEKKSPAQKAKSRRAKRFFAIPVWAPGLSVSARRYISGCRFTTPTANTSNIARTRI